MPYGRQFKAKFKVQRQNCVGKQMAKAKKQNLFIYLLQEELLLSEESRLRQNRLNQFRLFQ